MTPSWTASGINTFLLLAITSKPQLVEWIRQSLRSETHWANLRTRRSKITSSTTLARNTKQDRITLISINRRSKLRLRLHPRLLPSSTAGAASTSFNGKTKCSPVSPRRSKSPSRTPRAIKSDAVTELTPPRPSASLASSHGRLLSHQTSGKAAFRLLMAPTHG